MKKLFFAVGLMVAIALAFSFTNTTDSKTALEKLSGTYADPAPYNYGKAWGKRVFTFDKGKWTLHFTLGLDPELKMQVFTFRTEGTYKVLDKSKAVDNAYNAVFYEDKKWVTLKTADANLIQAFGFAACNLTKDVEKDISITGCSAWQSVADCPGDYDLLSLDKEGKLYFGERPSDNNMCSPEKRPTKLTPAVVKK
ncbi:MAG: hypothetical protein HYZ44_07555 [Bacteroidetes bacterium]|nr:hypothetical protein [Bacteroidota bacterium]